jgi:F-type H+-transporting ATPase subunit a
MLRKRSIFALIAFATALLSGMFTPATAQEEHEAHAAEAHSAEHTAHAKEKFNAGKLILEHVSDAHEWHVMTLGSNGPHPKHISLHLPVIVYSKIKGISMFSSARFVNHETHEPQAYSGYRLEENKIVSEDPNEVFYDLSITKNVFALLISLLVMSVVFLSVASAYRKRGNNQAPRGLQSFIEPLIVFIRDEVAKPSIGPRYERFLPFLLTVFFFIFINNLLGLIPILPGGANVTGNIAVTMVLALMVFFITTFSAKKDYWIHIFNTPGVPWWLKFPVPLMPIIELVGVISKPLVLCLRLFANITAGHIIALAFFSLIFIFGEMSAGIGYGVSVASVAFTIFMNFLELLVAFLQAYVFTLLASLYFGAALEEHHHEEAHH